MSMSPTRIKQKILFRLEQDDDGYPPISIEGLWAERVGENYIVDNIPFYAYGIAPGDQIQTKVNSDELWFANLLKACGSSVFRIYVNKNNNITTIRSALLHLSCPSEVDEKMGLIALEIPVGVSMSPILEFLMEGKELGQFDFEEGVLRHVIPE